MGRSDEIRVRDLPAGVVCLLQMPNSCDHGDQLLQATFEGIIDGAELAQRMRDTSSVGMLISENRVEKERESWGRILNNAGVRVAIFSVGRMKGTFEIGADGRITDGVGREVHILATGTRTTPPAVGRPSGQGAN